MIDDAEIDLVELPAIRAAFGVFDCWDLGEAYVVRDRLAVAVTEKLQVDHPNDELIMLESLLRATYGIAVANDLPVADTVGYAGVWRAKIAALASFSDRDSMIDTARNAQVTPRTMTFSLHRYGVESLLNAVAAALALPSQMDVAIANVSLPEGADRSSLFERRARHWRSTNWTSRLGAAARAFPVLDPSLTSIRRAADPNVARRDARQPVLANPALSATIPDSLRIKLEEGRGMRKHVVTLGLEDVEVLRAQPIFAGHPELIQSRVRGSGFKMYIDEFLFVFDRSPEPVKVGPAAEIHDVITGKSK